MEDREVGGLRAAGAALRAVLVAGPALLLTLRNVLAPIEPIVGRVPDDALFYLVIARHLRAGEGFSFDGLSPTTGFHPLWLALVTGLVPTGSPEAGFRGLLALHGAVTVVSVVLLERLLAHAGVGPWRRGVGAAAAGAWGASAYGLGMETALVGALALAVLQVRGRVPAAILGLVMGLTRVDAVPLLFGAGRQAPAAVLGGLLGVGLTGVFNRSVAGEWTSTSAALKGLGTVAWRVGRLDPEAVWRHVPGPLVAVVVVMGIAFARGSRINGRFAAATGGGICWIVASYLLNNLVGPWYWLPLTWVLVAGAIAATGGVGGRLGMVLRALIVVALLRGVGLPPPGLHATVLDFARAVRDTTPRDARVIAEDFPGLIAWFGERTVIPADGLAAEPGYRAALTTGTAFEWWVARGATHHAVTRRRAGWRDERPLVDAIAPGFLPVPASGVPLEAERLVVERVDAGGRLFALYALTP